MSEHPFKYHCGEATETKPPSEMASSSLANVSVSLPFSSQRNVTSSQASFQPTFLNCRMTMGNRDFSHYSIRAIAGGGGGDGRRDNLDHLQKAAAASKPQQPTTQTNKRVVAQPIGIWDRYPTARTVQQMMDTMERMIEDPVAYSNNNSWSSPSVPRDNGTGSNGSSYRRGRTPWEIKEGAQDYKMRFDMPGMTKGDVKVWVEEKMLVVKAEKVPKNNEETQKGNEEEVWSSNSYGRYNFRIALPENVEFEKIKAEVKDGVLYINIPKAITSSKILDINVQ